MIHWNVSRRCKQLNVPVTPLFFFSGYLSLIQGSSKAHPLVAVIIVQYFSEVKAGTWLSKNRKIQFIKGLKCSECDPSQQGHCIGHGASLGECLTCFCGSFRACCSLMLSWVKAWYCLNEYALLQLPPLYLYLLFPVIILFLCSPRWQSHCLSFGQLSGKSESAQRKYGCARAARGALCGRSFFRSQRILAKAQSSSVTCFAKASTC